MEVMTNARQTVGRHNLVRQRNGKIPLVLVEQVWAVVVGGKLSVVGLKVTNGITLIAVD
jgi:hypothetical protein